MLNLEKLFFSAVSNQTAYFEGIDQIRETCTGGGSKLGKKRNLPMLYKHFIGLRKYKKKYADFNDVEILGPGGEDTS